MLWALPTPENNYGLVDWILKCLVQSTITKSQECPFDFQNWS